MKIKNKKEIYLPLFLQRHLTWQRDKVYYFQDITRDDVKRCFFQDGKIYRLIEKNKVSLLFRYEGEFYDLEKLTTKEMFDKQFIKDLNDAVV